MSPSVLKNVISPKAMTSPSINPAADGSLSASLNELSQFGDDMSQVLGVLIENAPVAMAMFDGSMRYVLANRQWIQEFGLQHVQPLVGRCQYEIFPNLHPGWRQVYERALQGHIVRSEHDADGRNMVYRWEVRPWRKQKDTRVGGLMVTCEKFTVGSAPASAPIIETDENPTESAQGDPFACSLAMLVLDEKGVIQRANAVAVQQTLEKGVHVGKTCFWDVFGSVSQRTQVLDALKSLQADESHKPVIISTHAHDGTPAAMWICSPLKVARKEKTTSIQLFTAMAVPAALLPAQAAPTKPVLAPTYPLAPEIRPNISTPVPPPPSEELSKLTQELSRAKQELRTMLEAERAFVKREERLRSLLEGVPCGIFVLDERGTPIYQNERLTKLLGRPIDKDQGVESWLAHACPTPEHREHVTLVWRESVWRRQLTRTVSLATADGLLKELQFQPIALPGGGLLVSIQDDTEDCRHEEQLRSMEAKLRTLLQSAPISIVITDKAGVIFEVNQHAELLLGQSKADLRRYPLDAWLDPDSATARRDALRVLRNQGVQPEALGVRIKRHDGTFIDSILRLAAIPDAQGEPHGTIHYFQPPQEEHHEETAPAAAVPAVIPALAHPPVTQIISVELLSADTNGRIASWSEHAQQMFDFDSAMAVGRPLHLLFRPSDATGFFTELAAQAANPEQIIQHSYFGVQGRGSIPLSVQCREDGGFILFTQQEITVAPETEPEPSAEVPTTDTPTPTRNPRTSNNKAFQVVSPSSQRWPVVDLDREKLMLSETHHRIKNHLQIISSLLNLQINSVSDQHARNALRSSQNRVRAIAALHQHLYQLALGTPSTFSDFTRELVQHLRECYEASTAKVSVDLQIQDGNIQPEWLMPLALTLNEALSNSFEHAFPQDRSGNITATLKYTRDMGELIISDDGIGLPQDFHPTESSGLGLKILAVFAEQMRGQLFVQGTPDHGTEIKLRFPITTAAAQG